MNQNSKTPQHKSRAESNTKFEQLCDKFSKANIIITPPHGNQEDKEVSPTNSENSVSSGNSSRSSNQTNSTLLSEDSLYDNKYLKNTKLNRKNLYYNEHYNQSKMTEEVKADKFENNSYQSSPIISPVDKKIMSTRLSQSVTATQSLLIHNNPQLISMQDNTSKEFIIPQTNPRSDCIACLYGNILLKPCGHRMCESCVKKLRYDTVKSSFKTYSECVHCSKDIAEFKTISSIPPGGGFFPTPLNSYDKNEKMQTAQNFQSGLKGIPKQDPFGPVPWVFPGITPPNTPLEVQTMTSAVTCRTQQIQFGELSKLAVPHNWPVIKLTNIPWDISLKEVRTFFSVFKIPSASLYGQSIHIIMDRSTGKTLSEAYVEFATIAEAQRAVDTRNMKPLKGRLVSCVRSCQEDLMKAVFPKWKGEFSGCDAIITDEILQSDRSVLHIPLITREEINSLLVVCRNYKLHFSRKCAERPFENIISVLVKFPFHQENLYTTLQRDLLFEMLKLAIESLKVHLNKEYHRIDETLLERMMRAGILTPVFTERQKLVILQVSNLTLPEDLQDRLCPYKNDELEQTYLKKNLFPFYTFKKQSNPISSTISVSVGLNLLPSGLFDTKPSEPSRKYKGGFNPFNDDNETRMRYLHKELKLAQAHVKTVAANTSHITIPPPIYPSRFAPIQAFDVWKRLNEQQNRDLRSLAKRAQIIPQNGRSHFMNPAERQQYIPTPAPSYQPQSLPIQQYFDKGTNPFFVKDR
ncbi:hypothetical protein C1645_864949 [Glomus cerebriforme]|uniref:RRM domain-containing protein n=1 Tax=Glomus cerebriforme TaxID=658196 RepID=A0A397T8C3_9GLOM|nr:hypothetical protein C1645_864949 [Glomus cerebriforme]